MYQLNVQRTGMYQLNVQQTWPPVPGLEKHAVTDTIYFIFHKYKPKNRRVSYVKAVCDIITHKTETHITRLTSGVNVIYYSVEVSTPKSDLTNMELHVNSSISDIKLIYICMGIPFLNLKPYG